MLDVPEVGVVVVKNSPDRTYGQCMSCNCAACRCYAVQYLICKLYTSRRSRASMFYTICSGGHDQSACKPRKGRSQERNWTACTCTWCMCLRWKLCGSGDMEWQETQHSNGRRHPNFSQLQNDKTCTTLLIIPLLLLRICEEPCKTCIQRQICSCLLPCRQGKT